MTATSFHGRAGLPSPRWSSIWGERWPLACAALASVLALVFYVWGPPGVDAPAHLFQTWTFSRTGFSIWNNYWYAGRYQFVTYSLAYYPVAAGLGILASSMAACGMLAAGFASITNQRWGLLARSPSLVFALTSTSVLMISGMYPFAAGAAAGIWMLESAQRGSRIRLVLLALLSGAFSPLALLLTLVCLLAGLLGSPLPTGSQTRVRLSQVGLIAGVVLTAIAWTRLFPTDAVYSYDPRDLALLAAFTGAGLYFLGGVGNRRQLHAFFVLYFVANAAAYLVVSPIGSNSVRLFSLAGGPVLWLAARVGRRRPRAAVVAAVVCTAIGVQLAPFAVDAYTAQNEPAAAPGFWKPAEAFLRMHSSPSYRVEVVATWGHWESYYLSKRHIDLTRGWYRQDDFPTNKILYRGDEMTAVGYRHWLRSMGVHYVLLPAGTLDYSAKAEAALLRSGNSGLRQVASFPGWTVFALAHPTPILTTSSGERTPISAVGAATVTMRLPAAGQYTLRLRYTPYWTAGSGVCFSPTRSGMTSIRALRPGRFTIRVDPSASQLASVFTGGTAGCTSNPRGD